MPVKIFTPIEREDTAALEARVNAWMATLEQGAVRQISTAAGPMGPQQLAITVWYTQAKDSN